MAGRLILAMRSGVNEEQFSELAVELFEFQKKWNLPYANYCQTLGGYAEVTDWRDIPPVVTDVFKNPELCVVCGSASLVRHRFRTSGTTGEVQGTHLLHSLDVYESSIIACWKELGLPNLSPWFLTPAHKDWPGSSLGHMMKVLEESLPEGGGHFVAADGAVDLRRLEHSLDHIDEPVLLCGTALAFVHLFEQLEDKSKTLALPEGSRAFETGGYKGSGRETSKNDLYGMFASYLGLPASSVINEYSMTELSSQFYAEGLGQPHRGPSWARVRIVDPATKAEVVEGETGFVQIFDLANLDSVLAIETRDLAIRRAQGAFELIGRDPNSMPRGCSRSADEMMRGGAA
jgi:hypothetical protein